MILMVGAVAAGMQAASQKSQNPNVTMVMVFASVALAFFADPPRDPGSRERAIDRSVEGAKPEIEGLNPPPSPLNDVKKGLG